MEVNNDLRRLRIKYKILTETPNLTWVMEDLIQLLADMMQEEVNTEVDIEHKLLLINNLKKDYLKKIKNLTPKDPTQTEINYDITRY